MRNNLELEQELKKNNLLGVTGPVKWKTSDGNNHTVVDITTALRVIEEETQALKAQIEFMKGERVKKPIRRDEIPIIKDGKRLYSVTLVLTKVMEGGIRIQTIGVTVRAKSKEEAFGTVYMESQRDEIIEEGFLLSSHLSFEVEDKR